MIPLKNLSKRGTDELSDLQRQVAAMAERLRQVPSTFVTPDVTVTNLLWVVQGGNSLVSPPTTGIKYIGANVDLSTLPVPVVTPAPSPGDIVKVDAANPPAGLPDGIGTARAICSDVYAFVLNDNRRFTPYLAMALRKGCVVYATDSLVYNLMSGGVTYQYTLLLPEARN